VKLIVALVAAFALAQAPADKADALSEAARKGDVAAVKMLLDEGVDVNTKYRYNRTALSFAADRGHVEVVKLLIERGADLNVKDTFYNATALTWAINPAQGRTPKHDEVVRVLLQHGAQGKEDALKAAAARGETETIKVVLGLGGLSPELLSDALEVAAKEKQVVAASMLEQAGAKMRPELKLTAEQLARYVGSYQGAGNMAQVIIPVAIADGRLVATLGSQRLTLIARDETTFGIAEQPGNTVTFTIDQGKSASLTVNAFGNAMSFTRLPEK